MNDQLHTPAPPAYWDRLYSERRLVYQPDAVEFKDVFAEVMPIGGSLFEVGCFPGNFSIYLAKTFELVASGIDSTPRVASCLPAHYEANGVKVGKLIHGDFFTWKSEELFDVVCSFGFVEHFPDIEDTLLRHASLVAPGGVLFVSCPNFRRIQYWLHWALDSENLSRHVLPVMNMRKWRSVIEKAGLTFVRSGYYRTADFWVEPQPLNRLQRGILPHVVRLCGALDRSSNIPNRWLSPFMYSVWRKS